MKQEYIEKITDIVSQCDDLSMLDFVYQLLYKTQKQTACHPL